MSRDRQQQLTESRDQHQLIASNDKHQLTSTGVSAESIESDIGVVENELADVDEVDIKKEVESDEYQYNHSYSGNINMIAQKGMTFDHDLFFSPFLFPPKKEGKKKRRMNIKNRDQNSCLSTRSVK